MKETIKRILEAHNYGSKVMKTKYGTFYLDYNENRFEAYLHGDKGLFEQENNSLFRGSVVIRNRKNDGDYLQDITEFVNNMHYQSSDNEGEGAQNIYDKIILELSTQTLAQ